MLSVRIGSRDIRDLGMGGHSPVTVKYGRHGSEEASWQMEPNRSHPLVVGNASVSVWCGGFRIWVGTLVEPAGDGNFSARGLWRQGERVYPMDAAGNIVTIIDTAVIASVNTRQELTWGLPFSISGTPWADFGTPSEMTLIELLDGYAAENGLNWYISAHDRGLYMEALPSTPQWVVPNAVVGRGLTPAEDEFYTHLAGRYLDGSGNYQTEIVGSAEAATVFGRRTKLVDLTDIGNTTNTRAASVLQGMLLKSGARMGWGEGLELAHGQITTPGGRAATLNQIQSLQMVRLCGTVDMSRPRLLRSNTDVVLETVTYTDQSEKITATPFGYAPRSFEDAWNEALATA
ncbi:hypothetical protein J2X46_002692 [Nocardioides sp. BE266]|uniref:hypothetical protein n=1 Tax=Nocardioides sp. BE266 TaxID=2817725 RepID=UPI0028615FE8|nr:hypothetical protein [Nocardioides sp. BE266]MDR7253702.1 hypothetical protein [Nocardioides sp. BE266]